MKPQTPSFAIHYKWVVNLILLSFAVSLAGCSIGTGPEANLSIAGPPDFSAAVSKVWYEGGNGPGGPYAQYNVWLAIPPASTTNAGVVVATSAPVFVQSASGRLTVAEAGDIKVGSTIQVWHDRSLTYGAIGNVGAVQGPPGAPTYSGVQIVIVH